MALSLFRAAVAGSLIACLGCSSADPAKADPLAGLTIVGDDPTDVPADRDLSGRRSGVERTQLEVVAVERDQDRADAFTEVREGDVAEVGRASARQREDENQQEEKNSLSAHL